MKNKMILILLTIVVFSQSSELVSSSKPDRKQLIIDKFGSIDPFYTDAENYYSSSEDEVENAKFDQTQGSNDPKSINQNCSELLFNSFDPYRVKELFAGETKHEALAKLHFRRDLLTRKTEKNDCNLQGSTNQDKQTRYLFSEYWYTFFNTSGSRNQHKRIDKSLGKECSEKEYHELWNKIEAIEPKAIKIQAAFRGFKVRKL